jgi:hypothetical protein
MKRRQREAVIAALDDKLADHGSWCGETHLQKGVYALQDLLNVPTGFPFILYKYGPFPRELRAELGSMHVDGFLTLVAQPQPYGPTLQTTDTAREQLQARCPKTLRRYDRHLEFVAENFGGLGVGELERLATALWVRKRELPDVDIASQAARISQHKPHVPEEQAREALERVIEMEHAATLLTAP